MNTLNDIQLDITSPAFSQGNIIPDHYTCDGANVNPPINVSGFPEDIESLALVVEDPDAPGKTIAEGVPGGTPGKKDGRGEGSFYHWVVWNIPPLGEAIDENTQPGVEGKNSFGDHLYGGPCPPAGEEHRYYFKVFALDRMLDLAAGSDIYSLMDAMRGHIVARGELMGRYRRE